MSEENANKQPLKMDVDQGIANKLKKMIQRVSGLALLAATLFFVCLDIYSYSQHMVRSLNVLANVVSANMSAAIVFDDAKAATQLIASLREEPMVSGAIIYKPDWQEFVSTPMKDATRREINNDQAWRVSAAESGVSEYRISFRYIDVLKPIYFDENLIAYLFIEGSLTPLYKKLITDLAIILFIWLFVMFGVYLFSRNLHREITGPIQSLLTGMKKVSHGHDFSMRLPVVSDDEIGVITESFNDMLGQVQLRDDRLNKYRSELEHKVNLRTCDLKAAVAEAIESKEIAEQANQAKSEFLATMSHEIRTPMHGVLGMVDMMMRTDLSVKQKKYMTVIHKSGRILLMLLNNILDFSKVESGKLKLENVTFNIGDIVDQVINMMQVHVKDKGLELLVDISPDARCTVRGDSTRLTQILVNLISNAIKFTEAGHVKISIVVENLQFNKKIFLFKISDTGIGIDADKKQLIFDQFVQADGSMSRKYGGSGLGLAIAKKLVNLMGGEIQVDSCPGEGSVFTFVVTLQVEQATEIEPAIIQTVTSSNIQKTSIRILLAEDNEINQEVAMDMLASLGFTVDVANNGAEAVQMSQHKRYDVVLMDCQMPVQDGFEATREIRQLEVATDNHNIIIALTGNALMGDKMKCLESGMDDFLAKPYGYDDLETMLKKWLL